MAYRPNRLPRVIVGLALLPFALAAVLFGLFLLWGGGVG